MIPRSLLGRGAVHSVRISAETLGLMLLLGAGDGHAGVPTKPENGGARGRVESPMRSLHLEDGKRWACPYRRRRCRTTVPR